MIYWYTQYTNKYKYEEYDKLKQLEIELSKYHHRYPLTQSKVEETEENKKRKMVEEDTPDGNVKMMYDEYSQSFFYWSNKSITFKNLETVARKYVIMYECKDLYIEKKVMNDSKMESKIFVQKNIKKPVMTVGNVYKWIGKEYVEPKVEVVETKKISYLDYKKTI